MKLGKNSKKRTQPSPAEINALIALYNGRRYSEAESWISTLLEQYPDAGFLWKLLGALLHKQGKDALPALQKAAHLLPDDFEVHNNLGNTLRALDQFDAAVVSYRRAAALQPGSFPVHYNLGNTLRALGHFDEAVSSYHRAIKITPDFADAHNKLGIALHGLEQIDLALASFQRAVELKPNNAELHNNLGLALKILGQYDAALTSFHRAVEIAPDFAAAQLNLSKSLFEVGAFDEAVLSYHKAFPLKSTDQTSVNDIMGVKEYCERTGSDYHLIQLPQSINVAIPNYIGGKISVIEGVTQSSEFYVAELSQAKILAKHNIVISGHNTVLYDNLVHPLRDTVDLRFEGAIRFHANMKMLIDQSAFKTKTAFRGIHLSGVSASVYGHWIFEHLPKIQFFNAVSQYDDYPIYVDAAMPPSHYQALELLTQGSREVIVMNPDEAVEFEKLVVAPTPTFFPFSFKPGTPVSVYGGLVSLDASVYLRENILSALGLSVAPVPKERKGRRIFIGRKHQGRALINQVEIQEYLSAYNFEVIYPEELTFAQQVAIFNESEYVFGPNGSAFSNVIFCKEGAKIVSFVHSYRVNFSSWQEVLRRLGCNHLYVVGHTVPTKVWHEHHSDYVIPLSLVKETLDYFGIGAISS